MKNSQNDLSTNNCFTKLLYPCVNLFSFLNVGQIHPSEPITPLNSEYISLDVHKKIRVLHIKPKSNIVYEKVIKTDKRVSRSSLSDEYWFTQWSKPHRNNSCNCSFRRSARFSKVSDEFALLNGSFTRKNVASSTTVRYKVPTKFVNIESFVESLVKESFIEAYKDYSLLKNIKLSNNVCDILDATCGSSVKDVKINFDRDKGIDNPCFTTTIDENIVQIRKNIKTDDNSPSNVESANNEIAKSAVSRKKLCVHGQSFKVKPLIILLHGIGSSADVWWDIITSLQNRGYEVVAPDMLGHGFSSVPTHPKDYTFKNLVNTTLAVFEKYIPSDGNRKCIIIGHSFGCSIATAIYKHRAPNIAQLILISGGGPTPLVSPVTEDTSFYACLRTVFKPLMFCGLKRSLFYSSRGKYFTACEKNNAIPEYVLQYIYRGQNWLEGDAAYHRRIMIPTLLVHGLQDSNITLVQECEMERTIPRSFLELLPNAGHMAMLETPEQLSHMILCFMESWTI